MLKHLLLFTLLLSSRVHAEDWRTPTLENQVYLNTDQGLVIVELAPFAAPKHVERFTALVQSGFYDGLDFYRVIDGFVAQGGDMSGEKSSELKSALPPEFTHSITDSDPYIRVQKPDFKAPETGYLHGFAVGRDPSDKAQWLLHCPGTLAMARGNAADSATTDFYIVIGQATRHLDRNMSSFGRVIYGMPAVQALSRAHINEASGVIEEQQNRSKILWAKMAKDVPTESRIDVEVQDEASKLVQQRLASAKTLDHEFFHFKGNGNLDLCYYQLKSRVVTKKPAQ